MILVHLDPYMSICLPRNCPRLDKVARLLIHIIATLSRRHIMLAIRIQAFLPPTHRLIVELAALLLELIVADVESVAAEAVVAVAHPALRVQVI